MNDQVIRPLNPNLSASDTERLERLRRAREAGRYMGAPDTPSKGHAQTSSRFTASGWMSQAGYESGKRAEAAVARSQAEEAEAKGWPYYLTWLMLIGLGLCLLYAGVSNFIAAVVAK